MLAVVLVEPLPAPARRRARPSYAMVSGRSMESTLEDGDLVITREHRSYHVGEIIAYRGARTATRSPGSGWSTASWADRPPPATSPGVTTAPASTRGGPAPSDVIGSVALRIPYGGSVLSVLREPPVFAWFVGSIVLVALWNLDRRRRSQPAPV